MPRTVGFQFLKPLIAGSTYPATASRCVSTYSRRYLGIMQSPSMSFLASIIPTCVMPTSGSYRLFSGTVARHHGHVHDPKPGEEYVSHIVALIVCRPEGLLTCDLRIHVTFITREGDQVHIDAAEGDNLLDIAQAHDLDMEGISKFSRI
jgi:hypothetical protein